MVEISIIPDNIGDIAVFSRMRGNRILEKLTVQDCNTPHSCDYRYKKLRHLLKFFQIQTK